ncbi:hypothetical protein DL237_14830 [Pseudooceanicola sediminis]|uniref:AAA+ family ATPase n=1 Tax=Pseudooceanicola sediminis TaxID=2211117 RepID=A0A399IY93_9RHOB|nr:hypothetical protein [Pseudooceanicola sediminis]RII37944.1 hypothetical protein DL237_14830 [Pseudooceanicola sediminis]|tara:strand:+ start:27244 stop:27612 length:369 start_codon:yes stop_codon:yes gene_type:complete
MKRALIALALTISVAGLPPRTAIAQQDTAPPASKMQEGLRQFLDGLSDGVGELADGAGPALQNFLQQMGPAFEDILGEIKDFSKYEAPQVLPNGDILIRRKQDAPEYMPPVPGENPDGSVDL